MDKFLTNRINVSLYRLLTKANCVNQAFEYASTGKKKRFIQQQFKQSYQNGKDKKNMFFCFFRLSALSNINTGLSLRENNFM